MKKKKQLTEEEKVHYLDTVYQINEEVIFEIQDEKVVVVLKQDHWIQRFFRKLRFKIPKETKITLDDYGSFIFREIDGKKTIQEISESLGAKYDEANNQLYERLELFLNYLETDRKWISVVRP